VPWRHPAVEFKQWSAVIARNLDPDFTWPPGYKETVRAAEEQARAYFRELIARRRSEPGHDLLSALLEAEEQADKLTETELLKILFLLLAAGHETTVNLIANGFLAFARHPDQLERLRQDPSLIRTAVEEVMRFDPPVHIVGRLPLDDIELSCGTVHPFEGLATLPAAAKLTVTGRSLTGPTSSTSGGPTTDTSASASGCTAALGPRWPGSRARWRWAHWPAVFGPSTSRVTP
jgi:hypothetical protein